MKQLTKQQITSYDPVCFNDWIIKVSKDVKTKHHCIVMIHRFKHTFEIGYVDNEDQANDFITSILELDN